MTNKPHEMPSPYGDIVDGVCAADKQWFEDRPGEQSFLRPYVDGECWPQLMPEGTMVRVTRITDRMRTRKCVLPPGGNCIIDVTGALEAGFAPEEITKMIDGEHGNGRS
jgi:hypothetical protein